MTALAFCLLLSQAAPAVPTRETGGHSVVGGLVRSREWLIRRAPKREEEFVGDVSYRKGRDLFSADWALFRHDAQLWQARGRVRLEHRFESGDVVTVSGERAEFNQASGRGTLLPAAGGRVTFVRQPPEGAPDKGSAAKIEWRGHDQARMTGGVFVRGPRLELDGDDADYEASGELAVSGGRPVLRVLEGDWTGAVQADVLAVRRDPETIRADGRTKGWLRFKDKLEKLAE
jgi:hypothetical protein